MSDTCQSCKDERDKKGLPPMAKILLPVGVTDKRNFRKPKLATYVCPHCDGETLVASALKTYRARQA